MLSFLAGVAAGALIAASETPAAVHADLKPLEFWVGSCWRGKFPNSQATDTHCFTPMLGGRFVRDAHVVEGQPAPYSGETIHRWDPVDKVISYEYFASDGGHSRGRARSIAAGLEFTEDYTAPNGRRMTMRNAWTREGAAAYIVATEALENGRWREMWRMRFERIR